MCELNVSLFYFTRLLKRCIDVILVLLTFDCASTIMVGEVFCLFLTHFICESDKIHELAPPTARLTLVHAQAIEAAALSAD